MSRFRAAVAVLFCITIYTTKCQEENCDKLGVLFYEDLGCTPVIPSGKKCPTHYTCGDFTRSKDSCLYQGEKIAIGEEIEKDTYASCNVGCRCVDDGDKAEFRCAILDCPEWLGVPMASKDCYRTYTPGQCCSTGSICPPFDNITTCNVDGKEYKEGQTFSPKDTCMSCVCQKGFSGKYEAPFCIRNSCAAQVRHSEELEKNCAPLQYDNGDALCCPDLWACPSDADVIKKMRTVQSEENLTCKWGEKSLALGEGLETKVKHYSGDLVDVTCECKLPPLVTCKNK